MTTIIYYSKVALSQASITIFCAIALVFDIRNATRSHIQDLEDVKRGP
jgi:hypothetical protein